MTGAPTMAKKKSKPTDDNAGTELVRVNSDLARKIAAIVGWDGKKTAQFLDPQLRGFVEKEYARVVSEMAKEVRGQAGSPATPRPVRPAEG